MMCSKGIFHTPINKMRKTAQDWIILQLPLFDTIAFYVKKAALCPFLDSKPAFSVIYAKS